MGRKVSKEHSIIKRPLSSINSILPVETLAQIFRYVAPRPGHDGPPGTLLAFSHVCKRWREIALHDPFTWNSPIFKSSNLSSLMLERAKGVPLELQVDYHSTYRDREAIVALISNYDKLLSFSLEARGDEMRNLLARIDGPPSLLESLRIFGDRYYQTMHIRHDVLENCVLPRLRTLTLEGCMLPWSSKSISNLTTLEIQQPPERLRTSALVIIDTLARNPRLQKLVLKHVMSPPAASMDLHTQTVDSRVVLNDLLYLEIEDKIVSMGLFLLSLDMPSVTRVALVNRDLNYRPQAQIQAQIQAATLLLKALAQWMDTRQDSIRSLSCNVDPSGIDLLAGVADVCSEEDALLSLKIDYDSEAQEQLLKLASLLPLRELRTVSLQEEPNDREYDQDIRPLATLCRELAKLPLLEEIILVCDRILSAAFLSGLETSDPDDITFPSLQFLDVVGADLRKIYKISKMTGLRRLALILKRRGTVKRKLLHVTLKECRVRTDPHEVFKKFRMNAICSLEDTRIIPPRSAKRFYDVHLDEPEDAIKDLAPVRRVKQRSKNTE